MILDTTNKSLQFKLASSVTTNQLSCVTSWADMATSAFTPGSTSSQTNDTSAVTIVSSPASGVQRQIKSIEIYNDDTVDATVVVLYNDNSTLRTLVRISLVPGETLQFAENKWSVIDTAGRILSTASPVGNAGGDLSGTYPDPTVAKVRGIAVSTTAPTSGQVLTATSSTAATWQTPSMSGGSANLPLFNVEDYGAVGDGTTDDYSAILDAWNAMISNGSGYLFFPRAAVYRIDASVSGRLAQGSDKQYALFQIPQNPADSTHAKMIFGVLGVGEACVVRMWGGSTGSTTAPHHTASVLQVDYSTAFSWSSSYGLPSVFGAKDLDIDSGYKFTNVHFVVDHMIVRQPANPSMCSFNLEACSTAHVKDLYCDVQGYLDDAPEPTHPTGASLLMPRTDNAVVARVDQFGAWGMYTGLPITEHNECTFATIVRCKIGIAIRRDSSHFAHITSVSAEQCPWLIAGYDPSGSGANGGIVAPPSWTIKIDFLDVEDFDYGGTISWLYADSGPKAHIYDPNNHLRGIAYYRRVDSGSLAGSQDAYYAVGASNFNMLKLTDGSAATKLTGGDPVSAAPNAPTIGTATAGAASAQVAFTPASSGATATSFTATSTPGSITATGSASPITVTGLTPSTSYTFTVHASNSSGDSSESSSSNSVTPTASAWVNHETAIDARNGTSTHSVTFANTPTTGNLLVLVVAGDITSTTPSGWTSYASAVNGTGLYVFTKTATSGDTGFSTTNNASNYPLAYELFEFSSSAAMSGTAGTVTSNAGVNTWASATSLPGTSVFVVATHSFGIGTGGGSSILPTTWASPWTKSADLYTAPSGTDGACLLSGWQDTVTATSLGPSSTDVTNSNSGSTGQSITFAVDL